jgi:hypothetical protein
VQRDPRSFVGAPPGGLYRPALAARASHLFRAAMRQSGAACFSAVVTASVVVIAVNREPSNPAEFDRRAGSVYSEMESSLNFVDRWGETEFAAATPVEDFLTTSLTKTVRTVSFVRPPAQEAAAARPRFPVAFSLASVDSRAVDLDKPGVTGKGVAKEFDDEVSQYLWDVYERSPTKKDGSGDFTWKDPAAAKRVGMSLPKYVIGGMDPDFREQLYHAGRAMDADGIRWSILSAFRDDYRQRIASGIKASGGNSLHGGSRRTGGYGHGQAVDVAAADDGDMSDVWQWIDKHGAKYGLFRPMPGYDPAHIQSRGEWRKLAASLRQARIKEAKARAQALSEAPKAEAKASHVASASQPHAAD